MALGVAPAPARRAVGPPGVPWVQPVPLTANKGFTGKMVAAATYKKPNESFSAAR